MQTAVRFTAAATEIAGACGVPFVGVAALPLREVVDACDQIIIQKAKAAQIKHACTQLVNTLRENDLDNEQFRDAATQMENVLLAIRDRLQKIAAYNKVTTFWKRAEIGHALDKCITDLTNASTIFQITSHMLLHKTQKEMKDAAELAATDLRDLVSSILTSPQDLRSVVQLQDTGMTESLMREGQEGLSHLRVSYPRINRDYTDFSSRSDSSSKPRRPYRAPTIDSEKYLEQQRGLLVLHKLTGIPPSVKILNGEVIKNGSLAFAGGTYSDVWTGTWLGEIKVALKALRNVKTDHPKAHARFAREIIIWERLSSEHILPFFGIASDLGAYLHTVSPWQEEGNVLKYVASHPHSDKMHLVSGAAKGIAYLHDQNVIHGNVRCSNILVSSSGTPLICDFGISKVVADVTDVLASTTLTQSGSTRWLAPEIIQGGSPTYQSDTYSFSMAILELFTGQRPYHNKKGDHAVIIAVVMGIEPELPIKPKENIGLSDALWSMMERCWSRNDLVRPTMAEVVLQINSLRSQ